MNKDNLFFTACGLALGVVIGSFLIGPKLARSPLAGHAMSEAGVGVGQANAAGVTSDDVVNAVPGSPMAGANSPMMQVKQRIESLKQASEANPAIPTRSSSSATCTWTSASIRRLSITSSARFVFARTPNVRTDLGICYKQSGQPDQAIAAFTQVEREQPDHWQAVYNAAIVYAETKHFPEAHGPSCEAGDDAARKPRHREAARDGGGEVTVFRHAACGRRAPLPARPAHAARRSTHAACLVAEAGGVTHARSGRGGLHRIRICWLAGAIWRVNTPSGPRIVATAWKPGNSRTSPMISAA